MRPHISGKALLMVAGCCCLWGLLGGPTLIDPYKNDDFLCYYIGGTLAREGRFAELYQPAAQMQVHERVAPSRKGPRPYVRPPWFAVALAPLTALPFVYAYAVWIGIMVAIQLALWVWSFLRFGEFGLVLAALYLPSNLGLFFGQDGGVILAVLCVFYVLWNRQRLFLSGMVLGLGLIKPHLLLLFPLWMLLQKRWRMLGGFAAVAAAFFAMSMLVLGASGVTGYADLLLHGNTELGPSPQTMLNIYSVPANFGIQSRTVNAFLAAGIIGLAAFGLRRASANRAIGIAAAGSLLISPHVFGYDAALLLLPIWLVTASSASKAARYSALALCVPYTFLLTLAHRPFACIPAVALFVFFIALIAERPEQKESQADLTVEASLKAHSPTLA